MSAPCSGCRPGHLPRLAGHSPCVEWMINGMDVELLVVPDCPNESPTEQRLRTALRDMGLGDVSVKRAVASLQNQAEHCPLIGSPTILIDGIDPFPTAGPPSIACRIYLHPHGACGLPELRGLRQALKQAAAHNSAPTGAP